MNRKHNEIELNGIIIELKRDQKEYPYVIVEGQSNWVAIPQAISSDIQIGDSLSKVKGENTIYHFRNNALINSYY